MAAFHRRYLCKIRAAWLHIIVIIQSNSRRYGRSWLSLSLRVPGGMAAFCCHYPGEFQPVWLHFIGIIITAISNEFPRKLGCDFIAGGLSRFHFKKDHTVYSTGTNGPMPHHFRRGSLPRPGAAPPPQAVRREAALALWGFDAGASPGSSCRRQLDDVTSRRHDDSEEVAGLIKVGWATTDDAQAPTPILNMESLPSTGRPCRA
jgi:hypothetical protein